MSPAPPPPASPDAPEDPPVLDAVSRLLLAEAPDDAQVVAVVDGGPGLEDAAARRWPQVRVHRDRLDAGPSGDDLGEVLQDADLVLLALPTSLAALEEYGEQIARHAAPGVRVVAAGRVKHMTLGQNAVLSRCFGQVRASRGVGKCRALHASGPVGREPSWPRSAVDPTTGLELVAHGLTFGGTRLDAGTRLLLGTEPSWPHGDALDVGCGNGVLTAVLARRGDAVTAVDVSRAAVASTRETLRRNGLDGRVLLADGLGSAPAASADVVVTNPPFHIGPAKESGPAMAMIREAGRVLRPGGELWCVFNSHLPYLPVARGVFGDVRVVVRDRSFTVVRARGARG